MNTDSLNADKNKTYEADFDSTAQEARRLSIALKRFTEIQDPAWKEKYRRYLTLRFRPAMSELIRQGDFSRIRELCRFAPVTESALDAFIDEAAGNRQEEILAFLLEFKCEHFGFHDREFTL